METDHEYRETETPQAEEAQTQTSEIAEDVKEEVDKRDDRILEELRNIHNAINAQTEHHIRHLESHTLTNEAPVQETASETAEKALPDEPVSLEINEPQDMQKEEKEEKKHKKRFGKKKR